MKNKTIYALGFFDGVHLGHQALLAACKNIAAEKGFKTGVVTFASHPDALLSSQPPQLLNTLQERELLLKSYGMDAVIVLPFDKQLMNTHWSSFLNQLMDLDAAGFVCGSDFRFGLGGIGTAKKLFAFCQSRNLACAIVPQQLLEDIRVSSTYIRQLIARGEMERAVRFLGHPHVLTGEVTSGRKLGRTIGIPTANLLIPQGIVEPCHGVYACKALVDGIEHLAVTNVGNRPTVGGHRVTVETWLLDFDRDLYGKCITVLFHRFIRPEQKFGSLDELKAEIQKNALQTRKLFEKS